MSDDKDLLNDNFKELKMREEGVRYNETVPINRLPVELFCMLLGYLNRIELFAYEAVCKRWAYFVKAFVRQKQVIIRRAKVQPRYWFYLDERCPANSVMVQADLDLNVRSLIADSFLFGLKQLKLCYPNFKNACEKQMIKSKPSLNLINRLTALEVLEVSQLNTRLFGSKAGKQNILSLPNLKHLAISHFAYQNLLVDCPQLLSFKTKQILNDYCVLDFAHPTSVTHLYLDEYREGFEMLKNLQHLSITGFYHYYESDQNNVNRILLSFLNLKEISIRPESLREKSYSFKELRGETFLKLLKGKQALKRHQLTLIFFGISIEAEDQLVPRSHDDFTLIFTYLLPELHLRNYSRLYEIELRHIKQIDYTELEIPFDFYEKFKYVREIAVKSRVDNEDRLLGFIGRFRGLNTLRIEKGAQLGESFYRRLASSCPSISAIWMHPIEKIIDFEYIFEFKSLIRLTMHKYYLDDQFVRRLFNHFEAFELNYCVKNDKIKITRSRKNAPFEFSVFSGHLEVFEQLDDLFNQIEWECRNPESNPSEEGHQCDCTCEVRWCFYNSYAENCYKDYKFD